MKPYLCSVITRPEISDGYGPTIEPDIFVKEVHESELNKPIEKRYKAFRYFDGEFIAYTGSKQEYDICVFADNTEDAKVKAWIIVGNWLIKNSQETNNNLEVSTQALIINRVNYFLNKFPSLSWFFIPFIILASFLNYLVGKSEKIN